MPYWNFEYTKAVIYTVVKVGGGIGQDPATEQPTLHSHILHHITDSLSDNVQGNCTPTTHVHQHVYNMHAMT